MSVEFLKSTADLRNLQKQQRRRELNRKFETLSLRVTYVAGMYKARYEGQADVAFGADIQEAVQRLHKLPNMVRSVCFPKSIDVASDRAEKRGML